MQETIHHTREFEVGLGMMFAVKNQSVLSISGLGSCIGMALRDVHTGVSGLAHIVLPESQGSSDALSMPGKYADTAVSVLVKEMLHLGAELLRIRAKLVGGAKVLSSGGFDGLKNAQRVRVELSVCPIRIIAEDVGSNLGRSMKFDTATGQIVIRRFQQRGGIAELKDTVVI